MIEVFEDFLTGICELVARLERPVALPGFFHGADWVSVLDARPTGIFAESAPSPPRIAESLLGPREDASLYFAGDMDTVDAPMPRASVIRARSDERRDQLVGLFTEQFTPWQVAPETGTFVIDAAGVPLQDGEHVERVRWIDRRTVTVVDTDQPPDAASDRARYAISGVEGLKLMRAALATQVTERMREDGEFDAL